MPTRYRIAMDLGPAPSRSVGILVEMSAATAGSPTRPSAAGSDALASMPEPEPTAIHVTSDGAAVVIAVAGGLDESTGEALIDAATAAVATGPSHLDIDLQGLESFTDEGARAGHLPDAGVRPPRGACTTARTAARARLRRSRPSDLEIDGLADRAEPSPTRPVRGGAR